MSASADLREALRTEMERLLPAYQVNTWDVEWEPVTMPEPCERCGTRLVLILRDERRDWCEVTAKTLRDRIHVDRSGTSRTQLLPHTGRRCAEARVALGEPTQLDLLTGEPA